jgi:hypothetical protein
VVQKSGLLQKAADLAQLVTPKFLTVTQGEFEGRALDVGDQDFQVLGIDVGVFRRALEEVVGVFDNVLVEWARWRLPGPRRWCLGGGPHDPRVASWTRWYRGSRP